MTEYSEKWCEQYCADTVRALRAEMAIMDGDFDHELDYPDQENPGIEPTISHEVCFLDTPTSVDRFWWSPSKGWTYVLRSGTEYPMDIAVDESPEGFAAAARVVFAMHSGGEL